MEKNTPIEQGSERKFFVCAPKNRDRNQHRHHLQQPSASIIGLPTREQEADKYCDQHESEHEGFNAGHIAS